MAYANKKKKSFYNSTKEFVTLLLVVFLVRTFGFGLYQVPTGSMETTMLIGERFFADKFTILFSPPVRKQIIAFNDPLFNYSSNTFKRLFQNYVWGPSNWTKRVIGIPGDIIKGVVEEGKPVVYLNGKKMDEPYVNQYPLLALWPENPAVIQQRVVQEADYLIQRNQLSVNDAQTYVAIEMQRSWSWRPYVQEKSLSEQPYYTIIPSHIVKVPVEENQGPTPGITITREGTLLKEPHTPRPAEIDGSLGLQKKGASYWQGTDEFYVELGPDEYWLMGDNRRGSSDSRVFGPVKKSLIHGKILFRIWSSDSTESWWIVDLIKHPIDFWKRMRWSRFFQLVQ